MFIWWKSYWIGNWNYIDGIIVYWPKHMMTISVWRFMCDPTKHCFSSVNVTRPASTGSQCSDIIVGLSLLFFEADSYKSFWMHSRLVARMGQKGLVPMSQSQKKAMGRRCMWYSLISHRFGHWHRRTGSLLALGLRSHLSGHHQNKSQYQHVFWPVSLCHLVLNVLFLCRISTKTTTFWIFW